MMNSIPEEAKWIYEQKKRWPPKDFAREGTAVHHLFPPIYEAYAQIFHPFEIDPDKPDTLERHPDDGREITLAFSDAPGGKVSFTERKADGTIVDLLQQAQQRIEDRKRGRLVPTTWRSVAEKYGLTFHAAIPLNSYRARFLQIGWPRNLLFPSEGFLPRAELLQLLSILKEHTPGGEVYIFQYPPHSLMQKDRYIDLVRCPLEEVAQYFDEDFIGYLFAADHSWIVYTDTDLHSTLVGGSKALVASLKASPLEAEECTATTRVDGAIDEHNDHSPLIDFWAAAEARHALTEKGRTAELTSPKRHSIFNRIRQWLTHR